jgi:RNase P protein component
MTNKSQEKTTDLSRGEKNDVLQRAKAREIVQEIMNFGVSQSQIVYIIRMLALELEDVKLMNNLNELLSQSERFEREANSIIQNSQKKTKIYT